MYSISEIVLELCKIKALVNSVDNALVRGTAGDVNEETEEAFLLLTLAEEQIATLIEGVENMERGVA